RAAVTRWRVLERLPGATLLELHPETGRTHQLRVHLASLGHPIVADALYGRRPRLARTPAAAREVLATCPRQALHAASIRFVHPATGAGLALESPLPTDLAEVLAALRRV